MTDPSLPSLALPHLSVLPFYRTIKLRYGVKGYLAPRPCRSRGCGAAGIAGNAAVVRAACQLGVNMAAMGLLAVIPPMHRGPPREGAMLPLDVVLPIGGQRGIPVGGVLTDDTSAGGSSASESSAGESSANGLSGGDKGLEPSGRRLARDVIAGLFPTASATLYQDDPAADAADRDDPMRAMCPGATPCRPDGATRADVQPPILAVCADVTTWPGPATPAMLRLAVPLLRVLVRARYSAA